MENFQSLLLFLCATQLATSTEFNDAHFLQQRDYEIYQAKMQNFKDWLLEHNKHFAEHSCIKKCHKSCRLGISLASFLIQPNGNINARDLMIPRIHKTEGTHKIFVEAKKKVEFSPDMKNLSQESTNDNTSIDYENEYSDDDENEDTKSNLADWVLDIIYSFKEKHKFIQEHKIKLVSKGENPKNNSKKLRIANQTAEYIDEYRIVLANHQEPKIKMYQKSPSIFKIDRIFAGDRKYLEEHMVKRKCDQKEKLIVYKKPQNALKTNRIFAAEKTRIDVINVRKRRSHATKKTKIYKREKNEFGNERKSRNVIPLMAMQNFKQAIECKLKYIDDIICGAENLKPTEIKDRLKEFGFGNISCHWNRKQLVRKLSELLKGKRDSLRNKLDISQPTANETKCGRPIKLPKLGEDMYLLEGGDLLHVPAAAEKTFFEIDQAISQFVFKDKIYSLTKICERTMQYDDIKPSHNLEIQFILSYEKIGTVTLQGVGDFVVVGGVPVTAMLVKINGKWHERKNVPIEELQCLRKFFWSRENRIKFYQDNK